VIPFDSVLAVLRDFGLDPVAACHRPGQPIFRLPFLYLFGRSDSTLSYMGANIYPEDVEEALFADPEDERRVGAYCLELVDVCGGGTAPLPFTGRRPLSAANALTYASDTARVFRCRGHRGTRVISTMSQASVSCSKLTTPNPTCSISPYLCAAPHHA